MQRSLNTILCVLSAVLLAIPTSSQAARVNGPLAEGGDVVGFAWTPDATRLVYVADELEDEVFVLHAAEPDSLSIRAAMTRLSFGEGIEFEVSPDSEWVAFRPVPSCDDPPYCTPQASTYGAPLDGSQAAVRLVAGGSSARVHFNATSTHVVVRKFVSASGNYYTGLFSVPLDGPYVETTLTNPPGMVHFETAFFDWEVLSPDGSTVYYLREVPFPNDSSFWRAPIDGSLPPESFLDVPGSGIVSVKNVALSPDGELLLFRADLVTGLVDELFAVPVEGGTPAQRLGAPLPSFGDVDGGILFTPDGSRVLVAADYVDDDVFQLWSLPLDVSHGEVPVLLSGTSSVGGLALAEFDNDAREYVPEFVISAAAERVVYRSDERVSGRFELFSASLDGVGEPVLLNTPLGEGESIPAYGYRVDPRGRHVVFVQVDAGGVARLVSVPIDGSAPPVPVGGPFFPGGGVRTHAFALTPDGDDVVYVADPLALGRFELFVASSAGMQPARRLNGMLVAGGGVEAFAISPDGRRVAYRADEDVDQVFELFLTDLDTGRLQPFRRLPAVREVSRGDVSPE